MSSTQTTVMIGVVAVFVTIGCSSDECVEPEAQKAPVVSLDSEPLGAPEEAVVPENDPRVLGCIGQRYRPPEGNVQLPGYVRTFADPTAEQPTPVVAVKAYRRDGFELATSFSTEEEFLDGRIYIVVPTTEAGFNGYVEIVEDGYVNYRLQVSHAVVDSVINGYSWLATQQEVDDFATALGVTAEAGAAIIVGAVHDCTHGGGFGVQNAVIQAHPAGNPSSPLEVHYIDGPLKGDCVTDKPCSYPFAANPDATYTTEAGRFVIPNAPPGEVVVEAYGRMEAGGPLTQISSMTALVAADTINAVALLPPLGPPLQCP